MLYYLYYKMSGPKYFIYFHNWWGGFFERIDANNIGFFEKLLPYTKLSNFEITRDINKANVLIDAGKPTDNTITAKDWKYRINFIGEPVLPDHEKYDIVLTGINRLANIVDVPVSVMYMLGNNYLHLFRTRETIHIKTVVATNFCCFIVSNNNCPTRNKMFQMLNKYKKVNSGGRHLNNIGGIVGGNWWSKEYIGYISRHKFMICFENTKMETYSTEKIVNAYLAGVIPIYWSSHHIKNLFNHESMLFLEDETEESFQKLIEQVIILDNDDAKYLEFINRPIFNEHNKIYWLNNYTFDGIGKKMDKLLN